MTSPYGTWPSPFTPESIASASPRFDGARFVGEEIWWGESIPDEGGRVTVRSDSGDQLLAAPWSARSRVHEYGGGAWTADADGTLYFVDAKDQRVYRQSRGDAPRPLTHPGPAHGGLRLQQGRLFAVREDLAPTPHRRALVEIAVDGSDSAQHTTGRIVVDGEGFFAHPALSPDGTRLAWVQWDGTGMPWQHADLVIASLEDGESTIFSASAALQPEWTGVDELVYADDPAGRWELFRLRLDGVQAEAPPSLVVPSDPDHDTGYGLWVLGNRWFRPLDDGSIIAVRTNGRDDVVLIDRTGATHPLPVVPDGHISVDDARGRTVLLSGSSTRAEAGIWCVDVDTGITRVITGGAPVDGDWMPPSVEILVDGPHGPVHAYAYPPSHPQKTPPTDERPPYIVFVHGGPTAHVTGAASPAIAFYTSRGFGVLDVNYGGSSGYGRAYRERLDGGWGVVDVDDVLAAANGLVAQGLADPDRLAIRGGSAGGWTVLSALVHGGTFAAGISRYGVADLRMLVEHSHDFEAPYITGLVGPLPDSESVYIDRSPLTHADRIDVPVLLLQGGADRVVPPEQSEAIRDALAARSVDHEYMLYPEEGHGFRAATTIIDALERELAFVRRVFGISPAE